MTSANLLYGDLSGRIISLASKVHKTLGAGFLERVYANALALELERAGIAVEQECPLSVFYEGTVVGQFFADLVVEGKIVVELKASEAVTSSHMAQLLNYLRASGMEVGLVINFSDQLSYKRRVLSKGFTEAE